MIWPRGLQRVWHELRLLAVALQFLTRVPVRLAHFEPAWLHASARHFPLVGAAVGAFGAAVLLAALQLWPPLLAVGLSMAATVWLTGGFHEDGLADTCDALGGAVGRARALEIMKDSRLGSYGVLGLLLTLGLKAAALTALATHSAVAAAAALVLAHGMSRGAAVVLLATLAYAGDAAHAKAKPMAQQIGRAGLLVAMGWCGVGLLLAAWWGHQPGSPALLAPLRLLLMLLVVAAVTLLCARWLRRRLGGYTGDGLGATQQWAELGALLALAAGSGGSA